MQEAAGPGLAGRAIIGLAVPLALWAAGPVPLAAAELRGGAGVRIVQAAGVTAVPGEAMTLAPDGTAAGSFTLRGAPNTAVSLSLEALPPAGPSVPLGPLSPLSHDAGPTPSTDATGALTVRLGAAPAASSGKAEIYRIIVHY